MKKKLLKFTSYFILLLFILALLFQKPIRIAVADVLYDNRIHLTACRDLPTVAEVEAAMAENSEFLAEIEAVHEGVYVERGVIENCPGKADIHIYFGGRATRVEIERMIGGELLFGIPYRMRNI